MKTIQNTTQIISRFKELFQSEPFLYKAPGRINLIGEHTDYNEGFVLPAAIDKHIVFALYPNLKNLYRFYSADFNEYFEADTTDKEKIDRHWAKYLIGVIAQFEKSGLKIDGIDCVFGGDIPLGAGLSSSAALECGLAYGINKIFDFEVTKLELAKMAQEAEHEYAGVMCGIMDQFASMFGRKNHAIKLDCRDLSYDYVPCSLHDYTIVLCNTGVKHQLASSEYNTRRTECESGVSTIQPLKNGVNALRDVSPEFIKENREHFHKTILKRCLFVTEENERVGLAVKCLLENDISSLGKLMYASHEGLRNHYEVSCTELDILVDATKETDFVAGARMMGGGFGGCTINLVQNDSVEEFKKISLSTYRKQFGKSPDFFEVQIEEGVAEI